MSIAKTNMLSNAADAPGPSGLWADCPIDQYLNPEIGDSGGTYHRKGIALLERFDYKYNSTWTVTQAGSAGTLTYTTAGAAAIINAGHTDAGDGANCQMTTPGAIFIPVADKKLWFEACVKISTVAGGQFFIGLSEVDTTIFSSNELQTTNMDCLGFYMGSTQAAADPDGLLFNGKKDGTAGTAVSGATFEAATWIRLGFIVTNATASTINALAYCNGTYLGTVAAAGTPIVGMCPSLVCQAYATVQPTMKVAWVLCAQMMDDVDSAIKTA